MSNASNEVNKMYFIIKKKIFFWMQTGVAWFDGKHLGNNF